MKLFRRSSTPALMFAAVVFTSTLALVRETLFMLILKDDIAAASEPLAEIEGFVVPGTPAQPVQAPAEPAPELTPEEQREQTIVRVRGALGEAEPLPGAVPISRLPYGDHDPAGDQGSNRGVGNGQPGGPDTPSDVADLHALQRVGYQPVMEQDPLIEEWVPLAVAVSGGGLVAFLGLVGAAMLVRGHSKPVTSSEEGGAVDAELVSMTPRPGVDEGGFTDEDVLKVMRESKR